KKKQKGQEISKYLMDSHQKKKSTPTLGGVGIILSILITSLFTFDSYLNKYFANYEFWLI
ncbi:MAG: phospho-N-acetylmuramoyl-pentapeptide-transferase, partial [Clostridia bacterium]|nr:phospho-N-acetylmuramoyl-pentapeptide-transferase [Clostridia bacterium]